MEIDEREYQTVVLAVLHVHRSRFIGNVGRRIKCQI